MTLMDSFRCLYFFFQAEDGIRDSSVTGVQTCALPILRLFVLSQPLLNVRRVVVRVELPRWEGIRWRNEMRAGVTVEHVHRERASRVRVLQIGRASCRERVERWEEGGALNRTVVAREGR